MPCHTLDTLLDDPHLRATGLVVPQHHPTEGAIRSLRPTVLQDGEAAAPGRPAAPVGYDTEAVLAEAGLDAAEIARLIASGAARNFRQRTTGDAPTEARRKGDDSDADGLDAHGASAWR